MYLKLSNSGDNTFTDVGGLVEILRQRYFINHSSEAKTFINEEYTLISKAKAVTNIFLKVPDFLPNLRVYDSDGEDLPVLPNTFTRALIESLIDDYERKGDEEMVSRLMDLQNKLRAHDFFLIWIKLPEKKQLSKDEVRVINLEYNAVLEKKEKFIHLNIISPADHSVFYIIKNPEDHTLDTQEIRILDESGKHENLKSWKPNKQDIMYVSKTSDSLSITAKPIITNDLELIYSFKPQAKIVTFPIIIILLLSMSAFFLIIIQDCFTNPLCVLPNEENMIQILNKKVEISVGIIAASLIIPGLIKNPEIRHSLKWGFFLPVILALTALFA